MTPSRDGKRYDRDLDVSAARGYLPVVAAMSQHRKHRGYRSQKVVADFLEANGFPYAEPTGAGRQGTDILGTPGIDWEVKARRGLVITELVRQLDARAQDGLLGVGVIRPDGMGEANVHMWPAVLTLADVVALLRAAGYGMPQPGGAT